MPVTVTYSEIGGTTVGVSGSRVTATRKLMCAWADRHTLLNEFLTNPETVDVGDLAPVGTCKARSGSSVPFEAQNIGSGTESAYEAAVVTINFATPGPNESEIVGDDVLSESIEPSSEFITVQGFFRWGSSGGRLLRPDEMPGKQIRGFDYIFTRYGVDPLPTNVLTLIGKVNNAEVTSYILGWSFSAETLLYLPPSLTRRTDNLGVGKWDLTQRLSFRPETWNKFWNPDAQAFQIIWDYQTGVAYKNYPTATFSI